MNSIRKYDIMGAKENQATAKQAFGFPAPINEQTSDEIGHRARKRGFASLYEVYITRSLRNYVPKMIAFMLFLEHSYADKKLCKPEKEAGMINRNDKPEKETGMINRYEKPDKMNTEN